MTVVTPDWNLNTRSRSIQRINKIRLACGIKIGQGYHISCWGVFCMSDGEAYYVYAVDHEKDYERKTGLRRFELLSFDEQSQRRATYDEMMMLMHNECPKLLID